MRNKEKRLRELLGLKMSTPISRSSRLERALIFVDSPENKNLPFHIIRSSDYSWGSRRCRADEGVVNAEIIGADGYKNSYYYIWICAYTRKRCRHCGRLVAWGHENPMAPVCSRCAWEKKRGNE